MMVVASQLVPVVEPSTVAVGWGDGVIRIGGQSDEVRGSTVDDNDRHLTCQKIMTKKV